MRASLFFGIGLMACAVSFHPAAAQAPNSYQSNEGWGTGTPAGGANGAFMHDSFGRVAQRVQQAKRGEPFSTTTNQNFSIGSQVNITQNGNGNALSGNALTSTNSNSTQNNQGVIAGGNAGGNRSTN